MSDVLRRRALRAGGALLAHQAEGRVERCRAGLGAMLVVLGAIAYSSQIAIDLAAVIVGGEDAGRRVILDLFALTRCCA